MRCPDLGTKEARRWSGGHEQEKCLVDSRHEDEQEGKDQDPGFLGEHHRRRHVVLVGLPVAQDRRVEATTGTVGDRLRRPRGRRRQLRDDTDQDRRREEVGNEGR